MCGSPDTDARGALYAHAIGFAVADRCQWILQFSGRGFAALIRADWRRLSDAPFLLRNPRLYVGAIRDAWDAFADGEHWRAAARMILAAVPAVNLNITATILAQLEPWQRARPLMARARNNIAGEPFAPPHSGQQTAYFIRTGQAGARGIPEPCRRSRDDRPRAYVCTS